MISSSIVRNATPLKTFIQLESFRKRGYPEWGVPTLEEIIIVPVCAVHKTKPTSKIEFLLRRVEGRIAKSVFVLPNETSLNGFKSRATKSNLIHFSLFFCRIGFISLDVFPWVFISNDFRFSELEFSFLLVFLSSHFYRVLLRIFAMIYHFTK